MYQILLTCLLIVCSFGKKHHHGHHKHHHSKSSDSKDNHHLKTYLSCAGEATYKVEIYGTWYPARQPLAYPNPGRFSPLGVASHNMHYQIWQNGGYATQGVQNVAHLGDDTVLLSEFETAYNEGYIYDYAGGAAPINSTQTAYVYINVSTKYPFVSGITMVAPSPDWFTSFTNANMCDKTTGKWKTAVVFDNQQPYDAGTNTGSSFLSPSNETNPHVPISEIFCNGIVFCSGGGYVPSLATFAITLQSCNGCTN